MKAFMLLIALICFAYQAKAQTVNVNVFCSPRQCQARLHNFGGYYNRPLICNVQWNARLADGRALFLNTYNVFVPAGGTATAYIYSNFPNPPFVNAWANAFCRNY